MKIFNRKNKDSSKLFVVTSLMSVIVFAGFVIVGKNYVDFNFGEKGSGEESLNTEKKDSGIIIRDNHHKDPFITRATSQKELSSPIVVSDCISLGKEDAPLTIVQFSDFKCEYCQKQEEIIKELVREEYEEEVRLVWKDYPINDKKSISWLASKAARCANKQGKFWEYHDLLYDNSKELNKDLFLQLAEKLELDKSSFSKCFQEGEDIDNRIEGNIKEANSLGINGIPFLYINDREFMGKLSREELKRVIELELNNE